MITSALMIAFIGVFLKLRLLRPLLEKKSRLNLKRGLLIFLDRMDSASLPEIALRSTLLINNAFNRIADARIFSPRYLLRLVAIGGGISTFLTFIALLFISPNIVRALFFLLRPYWWNFIILPSVTTGVLLFPLDVLIAHLIARWAVADRNGGRCFLAFMLAFPLAYGLWAIGAGIAANLGFLYSSGLLIPSQFPDRIAQAWLHPLQSSARLDFGPSWFSYGLLSASSALSTLLASLIFLSGGLLKIMPSTVKMTLARPIFFILKFLDNIEKSGRNYPLGLIIWTTVAILIVFHMILRIVGA